jgi:N6-L-threonylcarbamoyladenine synthase
MSCCCFLERLSIFYLTLCLDVFNLHFMKILGIETSCDETAASIVSDSREILSHVVISQVLEHQKFGGVVPEIASRAHLDYLQKITLKAVCDANINISQLDAIAVTAGPGLIGGLLVGLMFAKGLSFALQKPLLAINHLEGHLLTARLTNDVEFPFLILLVSGGHCQILIAEKIGKYHKLGSTLDDALGEAFDKVAKMLGLGYPGGPAIEKMATNGNEEAYQIPLAMKGRPCCDFSFSGIKTAVKRIIDNEKELNEEVISNICASFQKTVSEILIDRLKNSIKKANNFPINKLVIAGGVAANQYLFKKISSFMFFYNINTIAPPISLCTDNGAMIAWAGIERFRLGMVDDLNFAPKARWPL